MLETRRCPVCGESYSLPRKACLKDGSPLQVTQTLIGKLLDDRYRIDDILGSGGMGTVYRATHVHLESAFAVKVLHPEMIAYEGAIERFRREAKAARRIQHPNAIEVTDFGVTDDKLVYLVMEIVEGRLLREMIAEGAFEYPRAVEILAQACAAIQAAHDNHVIHRDLKPDNIIVQQQGDREFVKVLDFGIAKLLESSQHAEEQQVLTQKGMLIGTPQYMSPEQCQGRELEPASDLYSLGIIGYEMLSGSTPFTSANQMGYISKHLREAPIPLRAITHKVPRGIERVIMQTLEKEPEARPSSAKELAMLLRQAVDEAGQEEDAQSGRTTLVEIPQYGTAAETMPSGIPTPRQSSATAQEPMIGRDTRSTRIAGPQTASESLAQPAKSRLPLIGLAAALLLAAGLLALFAVSRTSTSTTPVDANQSTKTATTPAADSFGEMALVPSGTFMMGSNDGDDDERPAHEVTVSSFFLDKYEVTNEQYKKCADAKQCPVPANWKNGSYALEDASLPVTHVTWAAANAYAKFAGKRLPTEAEWEYAARGGKSEQNYPWGKQWEPGAANVGREDASAPAPVGRFAKDQVFGIYDLAGNVSEWVQDDYKSYGSQQSSSSCTGCKVYRGGTFIDDVKDSRASKRWAIFPDVTAKYADIVFPKLGFRCAKDAL